MVRVRRLDAEGPKASGIEGVMAELLTKKQPEEGVEPEPEAEPEPEPEVVRGELIAPEVVGGFFGATKFEQIPEEETLVLDNVPYDNAQKLVSLRAWHRRDGVPTLRRWQKSFWSWSGTHWREVDDETVRAAMWDHLNRAQRYVKGGKLARFEPKTADVSAVLDALGGLVNLEAKSNPMPGWFGRGRPDGDLRELVALDNGLLHFGTRTLLPYTPSSGARISCLMVSTRVRGHQGSYSFLKRFSLVIWRRKSVCLKCSG